MIYQYLGHFCSRISTFQDEYITMNNITKPAQRNGDSCESQKSGVSKFDRYRNQDEDEMEEGNLHRTFGLQSYFSCHFCLI